MIRTPVARPLRIGAASVGVAGALALAGCAAATGSSSAGTTSQDTTSTDASGSTSGDTGGTTSYKDGTYTATGSYQTPESVESLTVTVTLKDDVITDVKVSGNPTRAETRQYQSQFIGGISDVVVGKDIDQISVTRVAGSSLTSGGFSQAIEEIKSEAAG